MAKINFDAATKGNPGINVLFFMLHSTCDAGYVKNAKFKPYFDQLEIFEQDFDLLFVKWIPREQNKEANQHAQQALYKLIKKNK
ncbi:hypothetical protein PEC69_07210 [Staphylococcus aureus]